MDELVVAPWVLRLSLWVMLATAVVLLATILTARLARHRRTRALDRDLAPLRSDVLAIASGDEGEEADRRLRGLRGRAVHLVAPLLISYLSKVRGAPAQRIVDVLTEHGLVARARDGVGSWSGTRRARSAWMLGVMRIRDAAGEIVPLLQDRDRGVAVTAARSLGMMREEHSAEALLTAVAPGRRGRGALPVWVVVEALGGLGPESAEVVGEGLASEDASTRAAAAMVIGRAQHLSQRHRLRALVEQEEDPTVLAAVARALGELGVRDDVPSLTRLVGIKHPRAVRLAAVTALREIGDRSSTDVLTGLLSDEDPRIGELAADVLTELGSDGVETLRSLAGTGSVAATAAEYGLLLHALRRPGEA